MKKLRLTMVLFVVLISVPMTVVVWRTYASLDRESRSQVRFFSEQLFDAIEADLADLVRREEKRAVDEYGHTMVAADGRTLVSPLAGVPAEPYILGYVQNNPDGSFQTPLVANSKDKLSPQLKKRVVQLETVNHQFNQRKRGAFLPSPAATATAQPPPSADKEQPTFADRFLTRAPRKKSKAVLGQKQARVEEITVSQAMNLAGQDDKPPDLKVEERSQTDRETVGDMSASDTWRTSSTDPATDSAHRRRSALPSPGRFQVEVAPLQTVAMDASRVFVFRRIAIDGQIYRQGVVIQLDAFLEHLLTAFYDPQPIARYTRLVLNAAGFSLSRHPHDRTGAVPSSGVWLAARTFPAPFDFLSAEMQAASLPPSPARRVLSLALIALGAVMVVGLGLIYQTARAVMELSERRSRFVSAVTHELKTPLTNIRMYIEMLEQGIAATPEREQTYLGILASESARLSGLITNVLELSRLEQQSRRFMLTEGDLSDVLSDVQSIMAESLAREAFELTIDNVDPSVFAYDRDVLVQVLVNLMENSIKFGRHLSKKKICIGVRADNDWIRLSVSDTGPGIPKKSLKKIFDDFYRVDNALVQTIRGTGIGLALVKKLILAMGGRVRAENNQGPGCTIIIHLPANRQIETG